MTLVLSCQHKFETIFYVPCALPPSSLFLSWVSGQLFCTRQQSRWSCELEPIRKQPQRLTDLRDSHRNWRRRHPCNDLGILRCSRTESWRMDCWPPRTRHPLGHCKKHRDNRDNSGVTIKAAGHWIMATLGHLHSFTLFWRRTRPPAAPSGLCLNPPF